jgi:hypothetical protein
MRASARDAPASRARRYRRIARNGACLRLNVFGARLHAVRPFDSGRWTNRGDDLLARHAASARAVRIAVVRLSLRVRATAGAEHRVGGAPIRTLRLDLTDDGDAVGVRARRGACRSDVVRRLTVGAVRQATEVVREARDSTARGALRFEAHLGGRRAEERRRRLAERRTRTSDRGAASPGTASDRRCPSVGVDVVGELSSAARDNDRGAHHRREPRTNPPSHESSHGRCTRFHHRPTLGRRRREVVTRGIGALPAGVRFSTR